ncbi:hypothetical protein M422DRAFT_244390 [Sphaerobolus stellatus SS14]|nr:hypothetical protein M422DRAFT_244390 [Sphaerobolus stellatus SS14]
MPGPPHFAILASQLPHNLSSIPLHIKCDVLEVLGLLEAAGVAGWQCLSAAL